MFSDFPQQARCGTSLKLQFASLKMPLFGVTEINVNGLHVLKIIHTNSRF
jgi:hypothetical protein